MLEVPKFTPTEFVDNLNQTLQYAYASILLEGEVASFKINQGKWVFFDLKDENTSINCFMTRFQLRMPLEDGMKVILRGVPKMTRWGRFSFTVEAVRPVGEGNIKKSFELLKQKLTLEGLFEPAKKRPLPAQLTNIGVISSIESAGYADFIKIINARWGGFKIFTAHTQVQGIDASDQIIKALNYFNERNIVDIIAILRGGGSSDDLAVFNDEKLTRTIVASKIPVITGIGHEVDESLADLAADLKASTPSNVAEMLAPDRHAELEKIRKTLSHLTCSILHNIDVQRNLTQDKVTQLTQNIVVKITTQLEKIQQKTQLLLALSPENVLKQGYAILSGKISLGEQLVITTYDKIINTEIKNVKNRSQNSK